MTRMGDFCVGSWSEMGPDECMEGLRHFANQGKIFYVHFRDVLGSVPAFREAFIGEGNLDMFDVMRALRAAGFQGFLLDDHVPQRWHGQRSCNEHLGCCQSN